MIFGNIGDKSMVRVTCSMTDPVFGADFLENQGEITGIQRCFKGSAV